MQNLLTLYRFAVGFLIVLPLTLVAFLATYCLAGKQLARDLFRFA